MESSIVCGVDGSPDSDAALAVAARMAERLGARLVLAHVADPVLTPHARVAPLGGMTMAGVAAYDDTAIQMEAGAGLLARAADTAGLGHVENRVALGFPPERLAEIADEENAELIVVGSRGRGAFKAAFLGSVSTPWSVSPDARF